MAQEKKYDVFISSKSEDYPIAEKVYDFLVANGLTVFLANVELSRIGEAEYSEAVDAAIDGAHHMIVVTTSLEYLNSKWVRYEWTTFANDLRSNYKEGNLLTILGPKIQLKDLPTALRHKQSFPIKSYKENILDYLYKDKRIDDSETPTPKPTPKPRSTHKPIKKSWIWLTIAACAIVGLVIIGVRHLQQRLPLYVERIEALPEGEFQVGDLMYKASEDSTGVTVCGLVNKAATEIHIPSQIDYGHYTYDVTSIGERAFDGCSGLTSISIPNSVTSIGKRAFFQCDSLASIAIPNGVINIGEAAFFECSSLTSVTIPYSVTSIGARAFLYCQSMTSISIPNSVTSIGDGAFSWCRSLASITIPNSVTIIGKHVFYACSSLNTINIPNSVTSIGDGAFSECENLTSITIPNSVTSIGDGAFSECENLTSITIPNSVASIGEYAFQNCKALSTITIPNSVTSIGQYAFPAHIQVIRE